MSPKAVLVLVVLAICLAIGGYTTADHPQSGTGKIFKSTGAGTAADPAIPNVIMSAGESHIGEVGGAGVVLSLNPTLDTTTYADGDTLFQVSQLSSAARVSGGRVYLQSVTVLDEDDQGQAFDLVFLNLSTTLGATNAAVAITDTNARSIVGRVSIGSSDYYDMGGSRVATVTGLGLMMSTTGTSSLFVGGVSRGAGTYSASGLRLTLGMMQD